MTDDDETKARVARVRDLNDSGLYDSLTIATTVVLCDDIDRLTRERDEWQRHAERQKEMRSTDQLTAGAYRAVVAERDELRAEVERLRSRIEHMARKCDENPQYQGTWPQAGRWRALLDGETFAANHPDYVADDKPQGDGS